MHIPSPDTGLAGLRSQEKQAGSAHNTQVERDAFWGWKSELCTMSREPGGSVGFVGCVEASPELEGMRPCGMALAAPCSPRLSARLPWKALGAE